MAWESEVSMGVERCWLLSLGRAWIGNLGWATFGKSRATMGYSVPLFGRLGLRGCKYGPRRASLANLDFHSLRTPAATREFRSSTYSSRDPHKTSPATWMLGRLRKSA